jgi:hypothetical protein
MASAGSGATGMAEAVATKVPNSSAVAHASLSLVMCVSSLDVRPYLKSCGHFRASFRQTAEPVFSSLNIYPARVSERSVRFLRSTVGARLS